MRLVLLLPGRHPEDGAGGLQDSALPQRLPHRHHRRLTPHRVKVSNYENCQG